ncbi:hypothetical protein LXL04_017531 [Taraxacum kok-saghyz]
MGDLQVVGGIKKLNNNNYNTWATCMMCYLQGEDPWEIVGGSDTTPPQEDVNGALQYRSFITAVQGWPVQPSLAEFENLLASQEAMTKKMGGINLKSEEEALYTIKH